MYTAAKARESGENKWDRRIESAVSKGSRNTAFLLVNSFDDGREQTEACNALKVRGFVITGTDYHDFECDRINFTW